MRLRTKLAIVLLALTLVLSGAVLAGLDFYKQQAVNEVQSNVNETADLSADQIDSLIEARRDRVGLVASRSQAAQFEQSDSYLDSFLASGRFYAAQIIAANGTVISFRGQIDKRVRQRAIGNKTNATYFTAARNQSAYVSDAKQIESTGTYILTFSAPILTEANGSYRVKGVLAASVKLDETVFTAVEALEKSSQTVEITEGGEVLKPANRTFAAATSGSATVETTGWTVTVTRDRSQLNERLRQLGIFQGLGLGIVLFAMVGYGYWQYAVSLRQTERLLTGFEEIQRGNFGYELSLGGGTEWEQINDGFIDLADGLRQREEALRERQQRLEVLYRVLRHNVRNKMSVVFNYAEVIADVAEDDMIAEGADTILDAGRDLTNLSQKARQIESAMDEDTEPQPIDVSRVIDDLVEGLREEYPDVDLRVSAPETAWGSAIPSIRMAIENVLENACKHNDDPDPSVEVSVTESGDASGLVIDVVDNGPGIPEQDRKVIEEGQETALEHGSGLGLWLVFWIVDRSGGRLAFDENEPRGSVVRISLQAADPPEEADGPEAEPVGQPAS